VSRIQINRPANNANITVHTARPGIVIGKKGEDIDKLRQDISAMMGVPVQLNVEEIRKPELDAYLVAESIAQQLEKRIMYRRAMKRAVTNTMRLGAEGIKINVGGRLNGAEMPAVNGIEKVECHCILCVQILITVQQKQKPLTVLSV
jgi:small subunit ribosomal protein S3